MEITKELLGNVEGAFINPPFYCDYGSHIEVGKNFFANYNCTIPCRVKRLITDDDKRKLFKDEEIDEEAWNDIVGRGSDITVLT